MVRIRNKSSGSSTDFASDACPKKDTRRECPRRLVQCPRDPHTPGSPQDGSPSKLCSTRIGEAERVDKRTAPSLSCADAPPTRLGVEARRRNSPRPCDHRGMLAFVT